MPEQEREEEGPGWTLVLTRGRQKVQEKQLAADLVVPPPVVHPGPTGQGGSHDLGEFCSFVGRGKEEKDVSSSSSVM